jgi:hypothetical protein
MSSDVGTSLPDKAKKVTAEAKKVTSIAVEKAVENSKQESSSAASAIKSFVAGMQLEERN